MSLNRFGSPLAAAFALAGCVSTGGDAGGQGHSRALDVFYVTDRARAAREDGSLSYGAERSYNLAYGAVEVSSSEAASAVVAPPGEIGRFPATPYPLEKVTGGVRRKSDTVAAHERSVAEMQAALRTRVAQTLRKEVVVFVHGYNNSFEDAVKSAAQICGDLGPQDFTCVALTWPAGGSGGILMGYNVDRESGEFSITDIRKAIRIIADTPGVRRLHFVAHSRGTDVLTTALQHLAIEAYVTQQSLSTRFKVANIILAAPDMDIDVAFARLMAVPSDPDMQFGRAPQRSVVFKTGDMHYTVYSSASDRALGLSKMLFGSQLRLGLLDAHSDPSEIKFAPHVAGVADFISVQGGDWIGHSYFLSDATVRADLTALIRDGKMPGEAGRPAVEVNRPFWYLPDRVQAAK
ncbi:MAG TPA: alpha/beta hydrolase [Methylocystis sp.]|jgi:esterase/lipase superfamily enzyme